jgi:hypothetical protein
MIHLFWLCFKPKHDVYTLTIWFQKAVKTYWKSMDLHRTPRTGYNQEKHRAQVYDRPGQPGPTPRSWIPGIPQTRIHLCTRFTRGRPKYQVCPAQDDHMLRTRHSVGFAAAADERQISIPRRPWHPCKECGALHLNS